MVEGSKPYTQETLRELKWNNLGYRFAAAFGDRDIAEIDYIYEQMAQLYTSVSRAGDQSRLLARVTAHINESDYFNTVNEPDTREKVLREVVQRRGQMEFRNNLLAAYNGRCVVSNCDAIPALEAAHIVPYTANGTHAISNGLLLRADLHTLFDLDLIAIQPASRKVVLANELQNTAYAEFDGAKLRAPEKPEATPSEEVLLHRWTTGKWQTS